MRIFFASRQHEEVVAAITFAISLAACFLVNGAGHSYSAFVVQALFTVGLLCAGLALLPATERRLAVCLILGFAIAAVVYVTFLEHHSRMLL